VGKSLGDSTKSGEFGLHYGRLCTPTESGKDLDLPGLKYGRGKLAADGCHSLVWVGY